MTGLAELRERLIAMRASLVEGMAASPTLDSGMLALLGNVGAALDALDLVGAAGPSSDRAVVADDGETIALGIYRGPETVAVVPLDASRALILAAKLLDAGLRHQSRGNG